MVQIPAIPMVHNRCVDAAVWWEEASASYVRSRSRRYPGGRFSDAANGVLDVLDRQAVLGPFGYQAQEVGDLQGQDAGEGVDGDVVVGPVEHLLTAEV